MAAWLGTVLTVFLVFFPNLRASKEQTLYDVLSAIEKMVEYYGGNYQVINLDGIYGLRVLEGEFSS